MSATRPIEVRFWEKVHKSSTCWLWAGSKDGCGYGLLGRGPGRGLVKAHRLSWEMHNSSVPKGLCVLHRCDNPSCVRPDHLFLGTQKANADDREDKGRGNHLRGEQHWTRKNPEKLCRGDQHWTRTVRPWRGTKNPKTKLTEKQVAEIRTKYATGAYRQSDLGKEYGVAQPTIGRIVRGQGWR